MAHPTPDLLALLALDEDVDPEVIDHVAGCRACFAEIEALQQVVVVGRSLEPEDRLVAPHPRVWQRVSQGVNDGRVIPLPGAVTLQRRPVVPLTSEPVPLGGVEAGDAGTDHREPPAHVRRTRTRWSLPALVAAGILVVGLGGGYALKSALDPRPDVVGATQLNALPRWPGANGTASVEEGPNGQQTLLVTMQVPPTGHVAGTFEVWLSDTRAEDMVPMGTMDGASGRFAIPPSMDLATHPIVDVSLEPVGDRNPEHSDISVVRGRLSL